MVADDIIATARAGPPPTGTPRLFFPREIVSLGDLERAHDGFSAEASLSTGEVS
ncbi:hypothetical protein OHB14_50900 [Streptomyces sp. NBC_01613]|uniref:hypothetical protein n=1 Tax=Streptomyces sp. NBC_01613 TaxID=2975896 RepID=UPI00386DAF29